MSGRGLSAMHGARADARALEAVGRCGYGQRRALSQYTAPRARRGVTLRQSAQRPGIPAKTSIAGLDRSFESPQLPPTVTAPALAYAF